MFNLADVAVAAMRTIRGGRALDKIVGGRTLVPDELHETVTQIRRGMTLQKAKTFTTDPATVQPQPLADPTGDAGDAGDAVSTVDGGGFIAGLIDWWTDHF
jgi:hypothetical protein